MDNQSQPQTEQKNQKTAVPLAGFGQLIDQTWTIYKENFSTLILISLTALIIPFLLGLIPTVLGSSTDKIGVLFIAIFILITFITFLINLWGNAALIFAVKDRAQGIRVKEAFVRAYRKIPQVLWVGILTGLIIMGGTMLFIIPGIFLAVSLAFTTYIVVAEDRKGMDALFVSKAYIDAKWFQVFWRFLFFGIITIVVGLVPLGLAALLGFYNYSEYFVLPFNILWTPATIIFTFLLYRNLKEIKGGIDINEIKKSKTWLIVFIILGLIFISVMLSLMAFTFIAAFANLFFLR